MLLQVLCPPLLICHHVFKKRTIKWGGQFIWLDETKVPNFFHYFRNLQSVRIKLALQKRYLYRMSSFSTFPVLVKFIVVVVSFVKPL